MTVELPLVEVIGLLSHVIARPGRWSNPGRPGTVVKQSFQDKIRLDLPPTRQDADFQLSRVAGDALCKHRAPLYD
ncbi:hypothetical protein Tco_0522884 [Tanacetum coccineum]